MWKEIAHRADGSYVALAQSGNMTVAATPFDKEIATVSGEINATVIPYGDARAQEESRSKIAKASAAPSSVAADRAAYNLASGGKAIQGSGDLVADSKDGTVDVNRLKQGELPQELQRMTPEARQKYIQVQQAKRDALNARIETLSKKRADYLEKERVRQMAAGNGDAFDLKVSQIIAEQAGRVK